MRHRINFRHRAFAFTLTVAAHILVIVVILIQPRSVSYVREKRTLAIFNFAREPEPEPYQSPKPIPEQVMVRPIPVPVLADTLTPPSGICPVPGEMPDPTDTMIAPVLANWTKFAPAASISASDSNGDSTKDRLRWGEGLSPSGYDFTGATPALLSKLQTNQTFCLGTFTHSNFQVFGESLTGATLQINFTGTVSGTPVGVNALTVSFAHTETPNGGTAESARDIISIVTGSSTVSIGGQDYTLQTLGFIDPSDPAHIITTIRTHENLSNSFGLAARFVPSP